MIAKLFDCLSLIFSKTLIKGYDRFRSTAIYLLRNPFESLVSTKAEQDPYLDGSVISGPLWETEVRQKTYNWLHRTRTWICAAQSLHFLHYEKLRKETKPSKNSKTKSKKNQFLQFY